MSAEPYIVLLEKLEPYSSHTRVLASSISRNFVKNLDEHPIVIGLSYIVACLVKVYSPVNLASGYISVYEIGRKLSIEVTTDETVISVFIETYSARPK
jgi:hypothetical protein